MSRSNEIRILIASDGSLSATAAMTTARRLPWPDATLAFGVVVRERAGSRRSRLTASQDKAARAVAESTAAALVKRWPDVRVRVVKGAAADAIVRRARAVRADVIVLGWRGHGVFRRLLAGSVSRAVVRSAPCSVLIVRQAISRLRNIVIGFDGSEQSQRAVSFVARLQPPAEGRALLVTAAETLRMPAHSLMPADFRGNLAAEVARINRQRTAKARTQLASVAATLREAGWLTQVRVTTIDPLRSLMEAVADTGASLLVVGATGVTGLERVLLGSVAEGSITHSSVPVLVVR